MAHLRTRLATLAVATLLVAAVLVAVLSARFVMLRDAASNIAPVVSEMVRAPADAPRAERARERPRAEPTPEDAPPAPVAHAAAPVAGEAPLVTDPVWISRPTNLERFYPRSAFMRGIEGRVELDCFVEIDGRLTCEVVLEAPTEQGFAEAALALARAHTMQPATRDGAAVRARYRMIVPFSAH